MILQMLVCKFLCESIFTTSGTYLKMEYLGHTETLHLTFRGTTKLFSMVVASLYILVGVISIVFSFNWHCEEEMD